MKIAYASYFDAQDIRNWSGSVYYIGKSLSDQGIEMEYIDKLFSSTVLLYKIKSQFVRRVLKKNYHLFRELAVNKSIAHQIEKKLKSSNADLVFSPGSLDIASVETKKPIVFWSDAVYSGIIEYYSEYSNFYQKIIESGNQLEQMALDKSKLIFFSSDWAANLTKRDYKVNPDKIKVVPFGANLNINHNFQDIKNIISKRKMDKLKILFIGVDWYRKGGNILVNAIKLINKAGIKTELHIVGCQPDESIDDIQNVYFHGFISKATKEGLKKFEELFINSNLFILPTRSESYGLVFCEAAAFGLPSIATNTGGIPTIINDCSSGFLIDPENISEDIAKRAIQLFNDRNLYEQMSLNAYNEYETRLNWNVAGRTIKNYLNELL